MTRFERHFRRVSRNLSKVELMRSSMDETFLSSSADLLGPNTGRRFLDFYGDEGLKLAFERYGFFAALERRGLKTFSIETSAHDERHTLLINAAPAEESNLERVLELVVRRDRLRLDTDLELGEEYFEVLTVDWLCLRNPFGTFKGDRLRLPGQDAPGLGMGERVLEALYRIVERLRLDALVTVAEYFHNAVMYAPELPFADAYYQGQLQKLQTLLFGEEKLEFEQAAWAVHWGHVLDAEDRAFRWRGEAMVHPIRADLENFFASAQYRRAADRAESSHRYRLYRSAFDDQWNAEKGSLKALTPEKQP